MWLENKIFAEDLQYIINAQFIEWEKLDNKTVLVTGATGLIGYCLVSSLLFRNQVFNSNINVIIPVRNIDEAQARFSAQIESGATLTIIPWDIMKPLCVLEDIDYIVHGAGPTESRYFVEKPVETIQTIIHGTENMLELARKKDVTGFVYLSSMEAYGTHNSDDLLIESSGGDLDTSNSRNSYPEAKRLSECLCSSYSEEYKVKANSIRLAQTLGININPDDKRIIAEIVRSCIEKQNIILQTKGDTKRCYIYVADAVTAILTVLLSKHGGQIYNVANKDTYCSIYEMAMMVAQNICNNDIEVIVNESAHLVEKKKFLSTTKLNLNVDKIEKLGWRSNQSLIGMFGRMIECKSER